MDATRASKAVQYLIDSAAEYGASRADQAQAENMLRVVKALAMKSCGQNSISAQERDAYASPEYLRAIGNVFECVKAAETLRARREAAIQTIEAWRSMNANQRAAERGYGSTR
jgi:hypothetical protein